MVSTRSEPLAIWMDPAPMWTRMIGWCLHDNASATASWAGVSFDGFMVRTKGYDKQIQETKYFWAAGWDLGLMASFHFTCFSFRNRKAKHVNIIPSTQIHMNLSYIDPRYIDPPLWVLNHFSRWGWVFLWRMRILSGIDYKAQFTRHLIEFVFAEMKRFVGSNLNVILTRQTCGQHSSRAVGSKRRALAFIFSIRLWYKFWESKCKGQSDLGLCTISRLAKKCRFAVLTADKFCGQTHFWVGSWNRAAAFFLQVPMLCADLDWTLFYI